MYYLSNAFNALPDYFIITHSTVPNMSFSKSTYQEGFGVKIKIIIGILHGCFAKFYIMLECLKHTVLPQSKNKIQF